MRILLIEDDAALLTVLIPLLEQSGFSCDRAVSGPDGLELLRQNHYDAVVLDRMLPGLDGIQLLKAARNTGCSAPVLMLTALGRVEDRVDGLEAGADDYLVKPFDNRELIARLRALCRRPSDRLESSTLSFGDLTLDNVTLCLTGPKGQVHLSKNETALLEALIRRKGQLASRDFLFHAVWGAEDFVEEGNLDSYIHFARRRLFSVGSAAAIRTVRGMGYQLVAEGVSL